MNSLSRALAGFFDRPLTKLPFDRRQRVERAFPVPWDDLTPEQRSILAAQLDWQQSTDLVFKQQAETDFREGFKSAWRPNQRNAKRPRPSRQKVSDADILRVHNILKTEGIPPHKQCNEAYRRLGIRISRWAFRKRWNRLWLNVKKAT